VQHKIQLKQKLADFRIFFGAAPSPEPTTVRLIAAHHVYTSFHEDIAKATPNTQKNCFPVKPAWYSMRTE